MAKNDSAEDTATPKSRKKMLTLGLAAVLAVAVAFAGYRMFLGPASAQAAPEAGAVVALEPITVNLADGHYLKVGVALQATADAEEEVDGSRALDAAIDQFSNMKVAQLSTPAGRRQAKQALVKRLDTAYEGHVMDVYFTEFVMQ